MLKNKNNLIIITYTTIFLWIIYAYLYQTLKINSPANILTGYLPLLGEAGLDLVCALLALSLWRKATYAGDKSIFLIFSISFFAAFIGDSIYNVSLNILKFQYNSPLIICLFDIPFGFFLFLQLTIWATIIFTNYNSELKVNILSYTPFVIVSFLLFSIFTFAIQWQIEYLSLLGLFQLIDSALEVIGFSFATVCLARAKNQFVRFTALGYLFIVSSDFVIRYNVISGTVPYLSSCESFWILGLLLMFLGFLSISNGKEEDLLLLSPINGLQSQIAAWLLALWLIWIFLFSAANHVFSKNSEYYNIEIAKNFLSTLIPFSVLVIISSNYISTKISSRLLNLERTIKNFAKSETPSKVMRNDNFIDEINTVESFVHDAFSLYKEKHHFEIEFAKAATQVAHDIKSPLIALNNVAKDLQGVCEFKRNILISAIGRISEIAEDILTKHRFLNKSEYHPKLNGLDVEIIGPILEEVISEKKAQLNDINIKIDFSFDVEYDVFCSVNLIDFKRVISNLINNSIEAIQSKGSVSIRLNRDFQHLIIEIEDSGCGISKEILFGIKKGLFPTSKRKGNGLGLNHAITCIKEWDGSYEINSKKNIGTIFSFSLPIVDCPDWALDNLYIYENQSIVVIDDDPSIFELWKERFLKYSSSLTKISLHYFNSPEELAANIKKFDMDNTLFLIDYYYSKCSSNGLDLIRNISYAKSAFIVSNQYPNENTKKFLNQNGNQFLLKKNILSIPIHILYRYPALVLLDDEKMITNCWLREAEINNKRIVIFNKKEILMRYIDIFSYDTRFYLDWDLKGDTGINVANELHSMKFHNLYITSGYEGSSFEKNPIIKDFIGKSPPF